jgi:hypothetical protein
MLARAEIADSVRPPPKPIEAGPVSVREPKQLAWVAPQLAAQSRGAAKRQQDRVVCGRCRVGSRETGDCSSCPQQIGGGA